MSFNSYQVITLWAKVDMGVMAIKKYSAFPKAPTDCLVSYQGNRRRNLTPLQRSSRCILQPQPTGPSFLLVVPLTLDPCNIMLSVEQGGIKYDFSEFFFVWINLGLNFDISIWLVSRFHQNVFNIVNCGHRG